MRGFIASLSVLVGLSAAISANDENEIEDTIWSDGRLSWAARAPRDGSDDNYHLSLKLNGRSLLPSDASLRLFSLAYKGKRVHFSDLRKVRIENDEQGMRATGLAPDPFPASRITLRWREAEEGGTRLALEVENLHTESVHWQVAFPVANDLELGSHGEERYFYPARSGVLGQRPLHALNPYGGRLWWQVMSFYDEGANRGLSVWSEDSTGCYKELELLKPAPEGEEMYREFRVQAADMTGRDFGALDGTSRAGLAVYHVTVPLQPQERFSPPTARWYTHSGDWRPGLDAYIAWVRTWYKPCQSPDWWKKTFSHTAAHPRHWHGDNQKELPGDFTLADQVWPGLCVQLWGYWHLLRIDSNGQPISDPIHAGEGAYDRYREEYGGAAAMRAEVNRCRQRGARVTAYLEGVWMALQCQPDAKQWEQWGLMSMPGEYSFRDRGPNTRLCRMCSAHPGWQDHLIRQSAALLRDLDLDGIYLDSLSSGAVRLCRNPAHEHPHPGVWMQGSAQIFRKVSEAMHQVKPGAVLYTEEPCCDYMTQFLDGALSHATWYNLCGVSEIHPSGVDLFRFYFPEFHYVDIPSYEFSREAICRAFFNGHGVHRFVDDHGEDVLVRPWEALLSRCAEAFNSPNAVPLVPTTMEGIYANQFPGDGYTLYTLRNGTDTELAGVFLVLSHTEGSRYVDALTRDELRSQKDGENMALFGKLGPREATCWAVIRRDDPQSPF